VACVEGDVVLVTNGTYFPSARVSLDAAQKQVVQVDPATGQTIGTGVPLQVTNQSGVLQDVCDIAQATDGSTARFSETANNPGNQKHTLLP
jgi:hypothetical protein